MSRAIIHKPKRIGYASIPNFLKTLAWHREGILPKNLNATKLRDMGTPSGNVFPVLHTLQDLKLIDDDGNPTEKFDRLAQAYQIDQDAYQKILTELLEDVYSEVFALFNPAQATSEQLYDAFNNYDPPGQHRKMIALFRGLCRQAGLMPDVETTPHLPDGRFTRKVPEIVTEVNTTTPQETPAHDLSHIEEGELLMVEPPSMSQVNGSISVPDDAKAEKLGEFLTGLLQLPQSPGWIEENRAWWRQAVSLYAEQIAQALKSQGGTKS